MRICHVIDYFHTDVGYQEYYLAKAQAEAGHDVRVVTTTHRHHTVAVPGADEEAGSRLLSDLGVEVVRLPARQLGHDRAWARGLTAAIAAHRPDAVHCHGPFAPTTVRTAAWCRRSTTALLVDNHIQETGAPGSTTTVGRAVYDAYRLAFGPLLRRAVGDWVADGPEKALFLASRLGLPPERIGLEPLGFDPQFFHPDHARRERLRAERGWSDDLLVAVTGKLIPAKGVELVAAACERRVASRPMRLVLAGSIDPAYERTVREAAPRLVADGRLERLPMLDRQGLADLYLAADVVAFARLPSISTFEAAGTGARVVLGDEPFAAWLASMGAEIVSTDPRAMDHALEPPSDRDRSAAQAAARFSWQVIGDAFVRRYEAIR